MKMEDHLPRFAEKIVFSSFAFLDIVRGAGEKLSVDLWRDRINKQWLSSETS